MSPPVPMPRDDVYMATKIALNIFFEKQGPFHYQGQDWESDMITFIGTWMGNPVKLTSRAKELFMKGLQPVPEKRVSMEELLNIARGLNYEDFRFKS